MLTHPIHPDRRLFELSDLCRRPLPEELAPHREHLDTVVAWAQQYLSRPHPELGRDGPVCPFVQASMRKGLFYLAVVRGGDLSPEHVDEVVRSFRDWFLELSPTTGGRSDTGLKTILILFPDVPQSEVPRLIDATQERLKPEYVPRRLMIGEFHPGPPDKAGLWNPRFRPLASPLPMLVIRHMVPTDFAFLHGEKRFVESYLEVFGDQIPAHIRDDVRRTALRFGIHLPSPEEMAGVHPRVVEVLREQKIPAIVHRHGELPGPPGSPFEVAQALGIAPQRVTKSLFLRCTCHGRHYIVVCPVTKHVPLEPIARELGCERLEPASQQELSAWLGYSAGGVAPIAAGGLPVFLDRDLLDFPTVLTAAGEIAVELEVDPRVLERVTGARVVTLGRHHAPTSADVEA